MSATPTNREKEDLQEPLPASWNGPDSLGTVDLYGAKYSPPCCKLRMIFAFYGVKVNQIDGKKKDSAYKKIPVVVVQGRQINDSFVIVKNFARVLDGSDLSPSLLALEEMTTFGLMMAMERDTIGRPADAYLCIGRGYPCIGHCLLPFLNCGVGCLSSRIAASFGKKFPDLKDLSYYNQKYAEALGSNKFFHGDKPGIEDLSICGVLAPFHGTQSMREFIGDSGALFNWFERMKPQLKNIF